MSALAGILLIAPQLATASPHEAAARVAEGIKHFQAGDYKAADKAFTDAENVHPDEAKIPFDRACALAAQGEFDKAIELFQQCAAARDPELAALSQYNLADVYTQKAKGLLGDKPEDAAPNVRQVMEFIEAAAGHYRDCLQMDSRNKSAHTTSNY
ncbi:MAG: hypothetical protein U1D30_25900 [Planctomycetota bacterium]